jgi:N5-(carboxyethyl)ornithine synthase
MGFVKPSYPNENRVSLLPENIKDCFGQVIVEKGFGESLGIEDSQYIDFGAIVLERNEVFNRCKYIYSLKLLQPCDYELLQDGQVIIGWTHPTGSGSVFFNTVCQEKRLKIVDVDSQHPRIYFLDKVKDLPLIPKGFINSNSRLAGFASVQHALISHGLILNCSMKVALLSVGNVAQGALEYLNKFSPDLDIFTRSNMSRFLDEISQYDVIVNGVEVDEGHIIDNEYKSKIKKGALVIDAAADGDGAIQGVKYTKIESPIYKENDVYYYVVNNSPSLLYREASNLISKSFTKYIYSKNPDNFLEFLN